MESPTPNKTIRSELTIEQRAKPLQLGIDPGFVHHRKIQSLLTAEQMGQVDSAIHALPQLSDWQRQVRINYIYRDALLMWCQTQGTCTLQELLASPGREGVFCSVERVRRRKLLKTEGRVFNQCKLPFKANVEVHYDLNLVTGSTLDMRLEGGSDSIAIIAFLRNEGGKSVAEAILMGFPMLLLEDGRAASGWAPFFTSEYFEHYVDDFREFSRVAELPHELSAEPMRRVSESAFKRCIAEILGDQVQCDWGGESSDFFSSHLHLGERRTTAAFLFKGPARFAPMALNHLGKNNDQLVRLCHEPAHVLVVQHCHDILPAVRTTLRALAVQPWNSRRYCCIDGRDSLRLLNAYGLFERALRWSSDYITPKRRAKKGKP